MSNDPAAMLALFLSIDPKVIARDLHEAKGQIIRVIDKVSSLREVNRKSRTPEMEAKIAHFMMVQANELSNMPNIAPEFKTFYASFGAGDVIQNAETVAFNKGKLATLSAKMAEIRKRERLPEGEDWYRHEGPADYQALEKESEDIAEEVSDTIFVHVLRRYSLNEQADLFEKDPVRYEIQREIGGRALAGNIGMPRDVEEFMDAHIVKKFGKPALETIRRRTAQLRQSLEMGRQH